MDISYLQYEIQHNKKVASILSIKPTRTTEYITKLLIVGREMIATYSFEHVLYYWHKFVGNYKNMGLGSYLMSLTHDFVIFNKF